VVEARVEVHTSPHARRDEHTATRVEAAGEQCDRTPRPRGLAALSCKCQGLRVIRMPVCLWSTKAKPRRRSRV
jgi:hypothetical protein